MKITQILYGLLLLGGLLETNQNLSMITIHGNEIPRSKVAAAFATVALTAVPRTLTIC